LDGSHIDPFGAFFNLFQTEKRSFSGARTHVTDFFPCVRAFEMGIPEWPCPTLNGPGAINRAFPASGFKECAVSIGKFGQALSAAHDSSVKQPDFSNRFAKILSDFQQFLIRDPHDTRRSSAAVATLSAGELQSVLVPRAGRFWLIGDIVF